MLILRDFKCIDCGEVFEDLTTELSARCACGGEAYYTIRKIAVHGCDSFNSHYDEQIGQFFESAEQKKKILSDMGLKQTQGPPSPKNSNKTSIKMTKSQARKFDPFMDERKKEQKIAKEG